MTLQLNEISPTGNVKKTYSKQKFQLKTTEKVVIRPNSQEVLNCNLTNDGLPIETNAIVEPLPNFERKTGRCLTSTIGCSDAQRQMPIGFLNVQSTLILVPKGTLVAKVTLLSPQQAQYLQPVNPELMTNYINQSVTELIASSNSSELIFASQDGFWFPTPQICKNPELLNGIAKRIYDEL